MGRAPTNKEILLVDDDDDLSELVKETLEAVGYRVTVARDGACALQALATHPEACAAIVDLNLPDMTGLELVAAVRREPGRNAFPVLIMTGSRPRELGGDRVLKKPVEVDELLAAVDGVCGI